MYWMLRKWVNNSEKVLLTTLIGWWEEMGNELKTKTRPY